MHCDYFRIFTRNAQAGSGYRTRVGAATTRRAAIASRRPEQTSHATTLRGDEEDLCEEHIGRPRREGNKAAPALFAFRLRVRETILGRSKTKEEDVLSCCSRGETEIDPGGLQQRGNALEECGKTRGFRPLKAS